jgi:hypothetical protein
MDIYKVTYQGLEERSTPITTGALTGKKYNANELVNVLKVQVNVPNVASWLQLQNGNWIPLLQNSRPKAVYISTVVAPPTPPVTGKVLTNIIDVFSDGTIDVKPQ